MKTLVALAFLLIACASSAQVMDVTQTQSLRDGHLVITIQNNKNAVLVAYKIRLTCPDGKQFEHHEDAVVLFNTEKLLQPNARRELKTSTAFADCEGGVVAAVFGDGTTSGDKTELAFLRDIRIGDYEGLKSAAPVLEKVASGKVTPEEAATSLDQMRQSLPADLNLQQWSGEASALSFVAQLLREQIDVHVPSDETPQHQPRINDLTVNAHIPRTQAHARIVTAKLKEWIAALADGLGSMNNDG